MIETGEVPPAKIKSYKIMKSLQKGIVLCAVQHLHLVVMWLHYIAAQNELHHLKENRFLKKSFTTCIAGVAQ